MWTRFFHRVDRCGHYSRPRYTLHTQRSKDTIGVSLCGLALRGGHSLLEFQGVALQGEKHSCRRCVTLENRAAAREIEGT